MKYKIIFLREQNDILFFYKSKVYKKINEKTLNFEDKKLTIDISKHAYLDRNMLVYFKNFDTNESYSLKQIKEQKIDSDSLDILFSSKFLKAVVNPLRTETNGIDWFSFIIGLVIGGLVGAIILFLFYQSKLDALLQIPTITETFYPTI